MFPHQYIMIPPKPEIKIAMSCAQLLFTSHNNDTNRFGIIFAFSKLMKTEIRFLSSFLCGTLEKTN